MLIPLRARILHPAVDPRVVRLSTGVYWRPRVLMRHRKIPAAPAVLSAAGGQ